MNNEVITPKQKDFIIHAIHSILPDAKIYAFGSRIRGNAKKYSDIDIALEDNNQIPPQKISQLLEVFAQSDLPFKVDLLDYSELTEEFKNIISTEKVQW